MIKKTWGSNLWGVFLLTLCASSSFAVALSRQDGDRLQAKIDAIVKNAAADPPKPGKFAIAEREVNSYLVFNLKEKIPKGLAEPEITMIGDGALAARVLVDMDEVKRRRQSRSVIDPLNYLSGQVPLNARGLLRTREGRGQFYLRSADIGGVPLPKPLLQELIGFFSRTPQNPNGFDIDAPFNLPSKIREISVRSGESVVVQ
ncbi:MAG TPA: hypothetical protein VFK25_07140 [Candidatus Binatia bacterium]|nr:hypothetical protein [Candidatus Binatia bacterium]